MFVKQKRFIVESNNSKAQLHKSQKAKSHR